MVICYHQRAQKVPSNMEYFHLEETSFYMPPTWKQDQLSYCSPNQKVMSRNPGTSTTMEGYSKVLCRFFCSEADLLLMHQFNVYSAHWTYDHMQRSFSVTQRTVRYLKMGRTNPQMTKGKKQNLKKIAGQLVKTLKLTPVPTVKLIILPLYLILSDLFLFTGYKCCSPLLPFFHNYFNLGQR